MGDELLLTVVAKVESILNSRLLTQNTGDPTDAEPVTPMAYICGQKIIENKIQFEVQKLDYPCRNLVI